MVAKIPQVTNWSVAPQNGLAEYFTLMNTWLFESTTVISSANTSIVKMNEAIVEINNIAENAINAITFDNIAQLKLHSSIGRVDVLGYYTKGDGGGGTFYWDSTSTETDNGGTIVQATGIATGRWKRPIDETVGNVTKWGAKGDGTTDDTVAIQNAFTLNIPLEFIDGKTYLITSTITLDNSSFNRRGLYCNGLSTLKTTSSNTIIKVKGGSGGINKYFKLEGIKFVSTLGKGSAIEFAGSCGINYDRCYFENFTDAVLLHNESAGEFTENIVGTNCRFINCDNSLTYKRTNGNDSFHGSGLSNAWIDPRTAKSAIKINANCKPYNSPLTINCFGTTADIISNLSTLCPSFYGNLSLEGHNREIVTTNDIYYAGTIVSLDNFLLGTLKLVDTFKKTGTIYGNILFADLKPYTFSVKTLSNNKNISLGNDAIFYIDDGSSSIIITAINNTGSFPKISSQTVVFGNPMTFTNSGDILQLVVPTSGTIIQVKVIPLFNKNGTFNGKTLNNYKEI